MGRRVPPLRTPGVAVWQVTGRSLGQGLHEPWGGGKQLRRGGQPGGWDLEDQEKASGVTLSEMGATVGAGARVQHGGIEAEPRGSCSER